MLGYNTFGYKLLALTVSGTLSGVAGAAYALLFAYVGSTFASTQYSIYPLLWVLLGGAGTPIGPLIGTALMFYLVDLSSGGHLELHDRGRRHSGGCSSSHSPKGSSAPSARAWRGARP